MLRFEPGSRDILATLPPSAKRRLKAALKRLADDPMDDRLDIKLLQTGSRHRTYRCRVQSYRIVFEPRGPDIYVKRIFHRRDGYGWLERI